MLDVRRLRLLRELKIRGTLAGVADALAYSPSAVSQQLALLEKEVGVPLLQKVGRRVQLTPQAEILVAHTALRARATRTGRGRGDGIPHHRVGNRARRRLPVGRARRHPAGAHPARRRLPRSARRNHRARAGAGPVRGLGPRLRPGHRRAIPRHHASAPPRSRPRSTRDGCAPARRLARGDSAGDARCTRPARSPPSPTRRLFPG